MMKLEYALTDYHNNQHDGHIIATDNGEPRGLLEFSLFDGKVYINWIITHHQHRRQGIATQMVDALTTEHTGPIIWMGTTPDGTALRESLDLKGAR